MCANQKTRFLPSNIRRHTLLFVHFPLSGTSLRINRLIIRFSFEYCTMCRRGASVEEASFHIRFAIFRSPIFMQNCFAHTQYTHTNIYCEWA